MDSLKKEAKLLESMDFPKIVNYKSVSIFYLLKNQILEIDNKIFLGMELVKHGNLQELID